MTGLPEYIGREVAQMTAFEILSIFIGILTLLCAFGSLVIALLCLSQQEKDKAKIKMPILSANRIGGGRKTI